MHFLLVLKFWKGPLDVIPNGAGFNSKQRVGDAVISACHSNGKAVTFVIFISVTEFDQDLRLFTSVDLLMKRADTILPSFQQYGAVTTDRNEIFLAISSPRLWHHGTVLKEIFRQEC